MFSRSFAIICKKKNGIFTLKNEIVEQADFAQNGGNRVSESLKFKNFPLNPLS